MFEQLDTAIGFAVVMLLLSLIITIIVQAVSAVLDLRGRNLVWGLTKLFHQIDPAFQAKAKKDWNEKRSSVGKKIAEAVSTHRLLKHELSGRAKAIRADELLEVLQDLAKNPPKKMEEDAKKALQAWAANVTPSPAALQVANTILAKVNATLPGLSAVFQRAIEQAVGTAGRLEEGVQRWFDTVMDRTSDVYQRWSKVMTVVAAFALAFGFSIDAGDLYKQISGNADLRSKLTSMADQTTKQADQIIGQGTERVNKAVGMFKEAHADDPQYAEAIANLSNAKPDPQSVVNCRTGADWASRVKEMKAEMVAEFQKDCEAAALKQLESVGTSISDLQVSLESSKLRLQSQARFWPHFKTDPKASLWTGIKLFVNAVDWNFLKAINWRFFFGMLATALLLSLGAPFWYNTLRQLASLKPATAQKIDQEKESKTPAPVSAARAKAAGA